MPNVIRADISHAPTIARFNQAMATETENKTLAWDDIYPGVQSLIQNPTHGFYFVSLETTKPSATPKTNNLDIDPNLLACLGVTYEWSDWRNGVFWWIQSVYVAESHRGRGVFSDLYAAVKQAALASGNACGIRLYVERDNDRAYRTYTKLGMIETDYRLMEEEF